MPRPIRASWTFASAGIGTGIHLAAEQFRQVTGIEIVTILYRSGAPALADFLSGKVDFTFGAVPSIREHTLAGRARGLEMTRGRAPQLPDIPSMEELGYASVELRERDGPDRAGGDAGTHRGEVAAGQRTPSRTPCSSQSLLERGFQPIGSTTEEFRSTSTESPKWIRHATQPN